MRLVFHSVVAVCCPHFVSSQALHFLLVVQQFALTRRSVCMVVIALVRMSETPLDFSLPNLHLTMCSTSEPSPECSETRRNLWLVLIKPRYCVLNPPVVLWRQREHALVSSACVVIKTIQMYLGVVSRCCSCARLILSHHDGFVMVDQGMPKKCLVA